MFSCRTKKQYKPHHRKFSAAWYRRRRALHLRRYPDCDQGTRDNLDMFVRIAETKERKRAVHIRFDHEDGAPDVHDDPSWSPESAKRFGKESA